MSKLAKTPENLALVENGDGIGSTGSGEKVSLTGSSLIILNTIVGAATLAIPLAMKVYGLPLTAILLVFVSWLSTLSVSTLLLVSESTQKASFFEFGSLAFGNIGKIAVHLVIIMNNFGYLLAYLIILGSDLPPLIEYFFGVAISRSMAIIIMATLFFPLIMKRKMDAMKFISAASFFFLGLFSVIVILKGINRLMATTGDFSPRDTLLPESGLNLITGLPSLFLAFSFQFNFFPVIKAMESPTNERVEKMISLSLFAATTVYLLVGFFGYIIFGNDTTVNLLTNFTLFEGLNIGVAVLQVSILIVICMSYPVAFFEYRSNFISLTQSLPLEDDDHKEREYLSSSSGGVAEINADGDYEDEEIALLPSENGEGIRESRSQATEETSDGFFGSATLLLHVFAVFLALIIPNLRVVFNIVGALGSNLLAFILPALFYHQLVPESRRTTKSDLIAKFLLVWGVAAALICVTLELAHVGEVPDNEEPGMPIDNLEPIPESMIPVSTQRN